MIPYIEDQCFGDESKLKEFAYDRLRRELNGSGPASEDGSMMPESAAIGDNVEVEGGAGDAAS